MVGLFRKTPSLSRANENRILLTTVSCLLAYNICVTSLQPTDCLFFDLQNSACHLFRHSTPSTIILFASTSNILPFQDIHPIYKINRCNQSETKTIIQDYYDNKLAFIQAFFTPYATISAARAGPESALDLIEACNFRFPLVLAVDFAMLGKISAIVVLNQFSMSTRQSQQSFSV